MKDPSGPPHFIYSDFMFGLMLTKMQKTMPSMFGVSMEEYTQAPLEEQQSVQNLFRVILPIKPRRPGIFNDEKITNPDMTVHYNDYPIENIACPVLLLHAENDPMAVYRKMAAAAPRFQKAQIKTWKTGGHILFGRGSEPQAAVTSFLSALAEQQ